MKTTKLFAQFMLILFLFGCNGRGRNSKIEATGTIESTNVTISSKSIGEIKTIIADEGKQVSVGDTILVIDHEVLRFQLEQAIANEKIAQAQLALMRKGARAEDLKQAEEMMKQAEINFNLAKSDFERYSRLWENKSITQKQYEDIRGRYQVALAQLTSAKENYAKVKKIFRAEEIEQAQANVAKAAAAVALLQKNIRDCYIISPIDGFVIKKFVEVGETVSLMSSLVKVSNLATVNLIIYVSEVELGKVMLGQQVEIMIDAFPNKKYPGTVIYISPEAEFTPKNIQTKDERTKLVFAVKIEIANNNLELKPGMPADALIKL